MPLNDATPYAVRDVLTGRTAFFPFRWQATAYAARTGGTVAVASRHHGRELPSCRADDPEGDG